MHARIIFPLPYPSFLYIAGANRGKVKPASDRRHAVAASAIKIRHIGMCIERNYGKIVSHPKQHAK
jgi:hypothetical protein